MKKSLAIIGFVCFTAAGAQAGGPLGGGTFNGDASSQCVAEAGYQCANQNSYNYTVTIQICDNAFVWSAADAFGSVVWSYTMGLKQMSSNGGTTVYAASLGNQSIGKLVCTGDRCSIGGRDSCEENSLCEWGLSFRKHGTGFKMTVTGKYHWMGWNQTTGWADMTTMAWTNAWMSAASSAKVQAPASDAVYEGLVDPQTR